MSEETAPASSGGKKKMILFILIGLLSVGAAGGGTWYYMKHQQDQQDQLDEDDDDDDDDADDEVDKKKAKKKKKKKDQPVAFIKLESFTVNLQSNDRESRYLQVELSLKVNEGEVVKAIEAIKPEVRNQILLLLSSKKPGEINTLEGKKKLSEEIIESIRSKVDADDLEDDILDVLFTSFIIQ
ncbi:flagellar basal body-associated protein FliL [uncultured Nitrosomonas sp.]|uniref:flagellar basal body-associated protein FliL n=1 Tax=uncultured Nitrosomonas sp. TaxID=156424 RepID=UPI002627DC50|nr:flagellar basal body-associated protein FliL [uncultured Nitrosomonas sp.]